MTLKGDGTLGPLTRTLFEYVWKKLLFVPGSGLYVPNIIKNGDPSKGLVSFDPYNLDAPSSPLEFVVPQSTRCLACLSIEEPKIPVGKGRPTLVFENITLVNLHAIQMNGDLAFPPGYKVSANVTFGELGGQILPFTVQPHLDNKENYTFNQLCCEPTVAKEGQCVEESIANSLTCEKTWTSQGNGTFNATISKMTGYLELTVDTSNLTIASVDEVEITFEPADVVYEFKVYQDGGALGREAMRAFIEAAIDKGIAGNLVQDQINSLANSEDFRDHIKVLINAALQQVMLEGLVELPESAFS